MIFTCKKKSGVTGKTSLMTRSSSELIKALSLIAFGAWKTRNIHRAKDSYLPFTTLKHQFGTKMQHSPWEHGTSQSTRKACQLFRLLLPLGTSSTRKTPVSGSNSQSAPGRLRSDKTMIYTGEAVMTMCTLRSKVRTPVGQKSAPEKLTLSQRRKMDSGLWILKQGYRSSLTNESRISNRKEPAKHTLFPLCWVIMPWWGMLIMLSRLGGSRLNRSGGLWLFSPSRGSSKYISGWRRDGPAAFIKLNLTIWKFLGWRMTQKLKSVWRESQTPVLNSRLKCKNWRNNWSMKSWSAQHFAEKW